MSTKRIERVNSLIQKELGKIICKEIEFPAGCLVTITRVSSSPDLLNAKVFISVLPQEKIERVLEILGKTIYILQKQLDYKLRMRPIPKIRFVEEKETANAARIEELLTKI